MGDVVLRVRTHRDTSEGGGCVYCLDCGDILMTLSDMYCKMYKV